MSLYSPVSRRIFGLDLMRAIAIWSVILVHSNFLLVRAGLPVIPFLDGVDVFFALSGFLIGGILLRTLRQDGASVTTLLAFWRRRWLRTLPNYYLFLAINLVVAFLWNRDTFGMFDVRFLAFCQNLVPFHANHGFFPEAWSLSVEEWFYLLSAVAVVSIAYALGPRRINLAAAIGASAIAVAATWARSRVFDAATFPTIAMVNENIVKVVPCRLDAIAFGFLAAIVKATMPDLWRRGRYVFLVVAVGLLAWAAYWSLIVASGPTWASTTFLPTMVSCGLACLLPALDHWRSASGWLARFVTFTSLISYSLYLTHYSLIILPIQTHLPPYTGGVALLEFVMCWGITYALAAFNYRYFESRVLAFRDRERH